MFPKTKEKLDKEYEKCRKSFVAVNKESYLHYKNEAYSDLQSAENDSSEKWAITKAYQALFLMCNALLVKNSGYYSKDHSCIIIALLKNNIVTEGTLNKINDTLKEKKKLLTEFEPKDNFFEEISNIRITRNRYLYLPATQIPLQNAPHAHLQTTRRKTTTLEEQR